MMIGVVIETYDIAIDEGIAPADRVFSWRSAIVPRSTIKLKVKEK